MKFLELRLQQGEEKPKPIGCANEAKKMPEHSRDGGTHVSRCLHWAPMQQGEGYDEFPQRYGREFSKIYARALSENQLVEFK